MHNEETIRVGVIGTGHLGRIHLKLLHQVSGFQVSGIYDPSDESSSKALSAHPTERFASINSLIETSDAVVVASPTLAHYEGASLALKSGRHVFVEKPVAASLDEARKLQRLSTESRTVVQVGHVERFNPAYRAALPFLDHPMFIETHRLAQFNPRGTDVSVVLDLMVHDIDILLSINKSGIKKVSANGVSVISDSPDIATARVEFHNGCVANLTASRISLKNMRKTRFFQHNAYISVDFLDKKLEVISMEPLHKDTDPLLPVIDPGDGREAKAIRFAHPKVEDSNAILQELINFRDAIKKGIQPEVPIQDGVLALDLAYKIHDRVNSSLQLLNKMQ